MAINMTEWAEQARQLSDTDFLRLLDTLVRARLAAPTGIDPEKEAKGRARGFEPGDGAWSSSPEEQLRILRTERFTRLDAAAIAEIEQARREHHESV